MTNLIKIVLFGIVEGITEWLPISSTGHLILVEKFLLDGFSNEFISMFRVVIQLGAIMAVVVLYFNRLWPFTKNKMKHYIQEDKVVLWIKVLVACIPAAVVGVLFEDYFEAIFYNPLSVALALAIVGVIFIIVENNKPKTKMFSIKEMGFNTIILIGLFQLVAAIFPGVSRSGATIIGALVLGVSRETITEFTFFLAIPVMFGASLLKIVKYTTQFTSAEILSLILGMVVAFIISIFAIKFLVNYIKKHDFKAFGWYRIILGLIVLLSLFI